MQGSRSSIDSARAAQVERDFILDRMCSIVGITPMNRAASEWLEENVSYEPWQWSGCTLNIDARMASAIVEELQNYTNFIVG